MYIFNFLAEQKIAQGNLGLYIQHAYMWYLTISSGFPDFDPPPPHLPDGPPEGLNLPLLAFSWPIFLPTDQFLCLR